MKEWYCIADGNRWLNFGYVPETGLYHWEKDTNYCGYTAEELIERGAE